MKDLSNTVVFVFWEGEEGIFMTAEQYDRDSRIQIALETAKTWAEFKRLMPDDDFEELPQWWANEGDYVFEEGGALSCIDTKEVPKFMEIAGEDYIIRETDKFDSMDVWGVPDGDYPSAQLDTCDDGFPEVFVQKYGIPARSMVSGEWTEYPLDRIEEMTTELNRHGYAVLKNLKLEFVPLSDLMK